MFRRIAMYAVLVLFPAQALCSWLFGPLDRLPYDLPIDEPALEISMTPLPGNPELVIVVSIYNDSPGTNVLAAHALGPPYDDSNVTFFDQIATGPIFALGQGCWYDDGSEQRAVFPFVRQSAGGDGILRTATFDGSNWSVISQAGPPSTSFDSADCLNVGDSLFLTGHDRFGLQSRFYESTGTIGLDLQFSYRFCIGGEDDCLGGNDATADDDILGPADGAIRSRTGTWTVYNILSQTVTRSPWLHVGQNPAGEIRAHIFDVDPGDPFNPTIEAECDAPSLFTPIGVPAPHESGLGARLEFLFSGSSVPEPGWYWTGVNHRGGDVDRFAAIINMTGPASCDIDLMTFGTVPSGALGFQGMTVFPYLNGGAGILWNDYTEVDENLMVWGAAPDYPGAQAGGGPRAGCRIYDTADIGTSDVFLGASAHPSGGVGLFRSFGELQLRADYELPLDSSVPAITDTEAFATCP